MLFCNGTHSKGDPHIAHLTFTQKSKCGEGSFIHTKGHLGQKNDEMMSALPYQKKREKIYKEKKERKKGEKEHSAILDLCYH
jgi:hypothetical protein